MYAVGSAGPHNHNASGLDVVMKNGVVSLMFSDDSIFIAPGRGQVVNYMMKSAKQLETRGVYLDLYT